MHRHDPRLAIVLAASSVLAMGGVVAGCNAILPLLYAMRVGTGFCNSQTDGTPLNLKAPICEKQYLKLNLALTASLFTADGIMLFYGDDFRDV